MNENHWKVKRKEEGRQGVDKKNPLAKKEKEKDFDQCSDASFYLYKSDFEESRITGLHNQITLLFCSQLYILVKKTFVRYRAESLK